MRLDISCESSARHHVKHQALFSSKNSSKKLNLLQFLFGAVRVNTVVVIIDIYTHDMFYYLEKHIHDNLK